MADVACVGVADDVVGPFVAGGVCVAGAHVFGLEGFELLESAELVCHFDVVRKWSREDTRGLMELWAVGGMRGQEKIVGG